MCQIKRRRRKILSVNSLVLLDQKLKISSSHQCQQQKNVELEQLKVFPLWWVYQQGLILKTGAVTLDNPEIRWVNIWCSNTHQFAQEPTQDDKGMRWHFEEFWGYNFGMQDVCSLALVILEVELKKKCRSVVWEVNSVTLPALCSQA